MADKEKRQNAAAGKADAPELNDQDLQSVLKSLLAAYQPVLEQELNLVKNPQELQKQVQASQRNCAEEFAEAYALFEKFLTEDVAQRLLPAQARELLGPIAGWRWCFLHIRCCIVFGWLVCRWPRTFRGYSYYLYEYWKCVRQVIGNPVADPPTAEQRRDFETLVKILAEAFKPYLTDQLASVEFPSGVPDDVIAGKIDCLSDEQGACAIFERLLTTEAARALLGEAVFKERSQAQFFWFCRCWCICSLCFGCCLARARNVQQIVRCLYAYWFCLRDCFQPLTCQISTPAANACAEATFVSSCSPLIGIVVAGTAAGFSFHHYTLSYSWGGGAAVTDAVVYPDCSRPPANPSSSAPVLGGTLGYLDATMLPAGVTQFSIFLDVYDAGGGRVECTQTFEIKTEAIEITAAAKVNDLVGEDPFNPGSFTKLIKDTNNPSITVPERSIGGSFSVDGSAYTVGCDRIMTQFVLTRFGVSPLVPVPTFTSASGGSPLIAPVVYADSPSHPWQSGCFPVMTPNVIENGDLVAFWSTDNCTFLGIPYTVPKVKAVPFWDSNPLNGRFVILLEVRDHLLPGGPFPGDLAGVDQVVVWIDNQEPIADIMSIGGVSGCGDLHLKDYVATTADVLGVAWDPPIDPTAPQKQPNDNFGSYVLTFQKNGDPLASGTIISSSNRVPNIWPGPLGGAFGTLANWDIVAALDGGSGVLPPHSPKLPRGQRCAYVVSLTVSDTTHVGDSGSNHVAGPVLYAVEVINDIP